MKGKINHIKILFCAILLLFVTSLLLTQNRVMAEDENPNLNLITNLRSAKDVVDKAAKYHLLGTAMWECQSWVRGQKTEGEENNTGVFQERRRHVGASASASGISPGSHTGDAGV